MGTPLPFEMESHTITPFGHNKYSQEYKWVFFAGKDSPGGDKEHVALRHQELRDYADASDCVAFHTNGCLKNTVTEPLVDMESATPECGLWIRITCTDGQC